MDKFQNVCFFTWTVGRNARMLGADQSVLQSETDDQLTRISCAISSANFKLQVVLNKIFQKFFFSKSTSILPINYI